MGCKFKEELELEKYKKLYFDVKATLDEGEHLSKGKRTEIRNLYFVETLRLVKIGNDSLNKSIKGELGKAQLYKIHYIAQGLRDLPLLRYNLKKKSIIFNILVGSIFAFTASIINADTDSYLGMYLSIGVLLLGIVLIIWNTIKVKNRIKDLQILPVKGLPIGDYKRYLSTLEGIEKGTIVNKF